jgi:hypothetical protein
MRSRTEARFAAFFDALKWLWRYEPTDLDGYIPDFILYLHRPMLVEVKGEQEAHKSARDKVDGSGWVGEAIVVSPSFAGNVIGEFGEREESPDGPVRVWKKARVFFCISCGEASVLPDEGNWLCRVCGDGWGNAHVGEFDPTDAWVAAGNRVQWRPAGHLESGCVKPSNAKLV